MVDYQKLLRESRDLKFEAIASKKEIKDNSHTCYYSPKSHHKYLLENQLKEEENFLKNGEGCKDYDFKTVYKNVLRLKKQLRNLLGER